MQNIILTPINLNSLLTEKFQTTPFFVDPHLKVPTYFAQIKFKFALRQILKDFAQNILINLSSAF
jgi:hypothetical protein